MTQNRTVRRTAAVICFCALFCVLFAGASQLLRNKDSAGAILSLYEEPRDSLDVIFIGSSHILNGVLPLELWQEYGIVSNNLGQHGQSIPISYYMAQEAIRTQHPDLIVLDAYMLYYPELIYEGDGNSHKSIDNMAWSGPKLRAIFELFSWEDRWDYLVPLSFYHTRWKELSAEDLAPIDTTGKGCEVRLDTVPYPEMEPVDPDYTQPLSDVALEYFDRLAELCEAEGVELLLVCAPFHATREQQGQMNAVGEVAEAYGLPYWNYLSRLEEIGFDPASDLFDYSHLNANGALKFTHALGEELAALGVPDRRGEEEYAGWDEDYLLWRTGLEESAAQEGFPFGKGRGAVGNYPGS